MHPDAARELKARILGRLPSAVDASSAPGERDAPWPWVAVGLIPSRDGARVAVRPQRDGDRALLPDLGRAAAAEVEVEVIGPDEAVAKLGRTTGHTSGRITAVEVDGVAVQYGQAVYRFDDQIEIEGIAGGFSAGGDSGSVIGRSRDRAPVALLFAGSESGGTAGTGATFANPLATVLATLGGEWAGG